MPENSGLKRHNLEEIVGHDGELMNGVEFQSDDEEEILGIKTSQKMNAESATAVLRGHLHLTQEDEVRRTVEEIIKRCVLVLHLEKNRDELAELITESEDKSRQLADQSKIALWLLVFGSAIVTVIAGDPLPVGVGAAISLEIIRKFHALKVHIPTLVQEDELMNAVQSEIKVSLDFLGIKLSRKDTMNSFIQRVSSINAHRRVIGEEYYAVDEGGNVYIVEKGKNRKEN